MISFLLDRAFGVLLFFLTLIFIHLLYQTVCVYRQLSAMTGHSLAHLCVRTSSEL
jgi:hypothetical protein